MIVRKQYKTETDEEMGVLDIALRNFSERNPKEMVLITLDIDQRPVYLIGGANVITSRDYTSGLPDVEVIGETSIIKSARQRIKEITGVEIKERR